MGVQILNKDVSLISNVIGRPKTNIANIWGVIGWGGGGSTWTLAFEDVNGPGYGTTNNQTIPENVTLFIDLDSFMNFGDYTIYVNGSPDYNTNDDITISLSAGDEIAFEFYSPAYSGEVTIKENNSSGRIIDIFTVSIFEP